MIRSFRYPLRPNKAQEAILDTYLWRCRQVYNAALEQRLAAYRKQGRTLSRYDQQKDLALLRQGDQDFRFIPSDVLRSPLKRLDLAYKAFFRRVKSGERPGFPRFRGRSRYSSFSFTSAPVVKPGQVLIPKLGYVKFHEYRPLKGTPLDATIKRDPAGKWWVTFQCDLGTAPEKVTPSTHTGIDVGLTSFATLSAVAVDPRGTSQRCSGCGAVPEVRKTLADRVHSCLSCGLTLDRDHNAAINILALGLSAVEGLT